MINAGKSIRFARKTYRWGEAVFKLVIVEDEDNIRHSLECFIPWNAMGFQVVGAFSDGSDALAYLKEHPCDAVLTDILMSRMSGLELIRTLYEIQPQIKVVILSGHSDFAYAQQAIQYQVVHYLVKPVDEEELISVFKGLKEQLDTRQDELAEAGQENRELKQLLQRGFFRDLLSGRISSGKELKEYRKLLNLEQIQENSQLVVYDLSLDTTGEEEEDYTASVEAALGELTGGANEICHVFSMEERQDLWRIVFVGLPGVNEALLQKRCDGQMQTLCKTLGDVTGHAPAFRLAQAVTLLNRLLVTADSLEDSGPSAQSGSDRHALCEKIIAPYKLLIVELDLGSKKTVLHLLDRMLRELDGASLEDMQFSFKNLFAVVELDYKKRKCNVLRLTDGQFDINCLYRAQDVQSLEDCVKNAFIALCDGLQRNKPHSEHTIVERLVEYIQEHMEEDIGHEELAKKYRVHPGYLSRLFKQEMGVTLSEYLLRIRIEKAASLLKEGRYKIGDVAGMVGYSTSSYFSVMFKKYTGFSPREYSQRISLQ